MKLTIIRIGKADASEPLCRSCANAHMVKGFRPGEELIYCTFVFGVPRVVEFAVSECTDYSDRVCTRTIPRLPAGFIKPEASGAA